MGTGESRGRLAADHRLRGPRRAANLEIKAFDESANPYLVVAGLVHTGLAGITGAVPLPDPVNIDPASIPPADQDQQGIAPLPDTLGGATDAFEADELLTRAFGSDLAATIVDLRPAEIARFVDATPEKIVSAARWKY